MALFIRFNLTKFTSSAKNRRVDLHPEKIIRGSLSQVSLEKIYTYDLHLK